MTFDILFVCGVIANIDKMILLFDFMFLYLTISYYTRELVTRSSAAAIKIGTYVCCL